MYIDNFGIKKTTAPQQTEPSLAYETSYSEVTINAAIYDCIIVGQPSAILKRNEFALLPAKVRA